MSLRRTRSEPTKVKLLGSFSTGAWGGGTAEAATISSPKPALRPELAWWTTLWLTVISEAGTFHRSAAAWTSMARAAEPAVRIWV